jgi:hypothetical protein
MFTDTEPTTPALTDLADPGPAFDASVEALRAAPPQAVEIAPV